MRRDGCRRDQVRRQRHYWHAVREERSGRRQDPGVGDHADSSGEPSLYRTLLYDAEKDFTLVAVSGGGAGSFMMLRKDAPYGSLAEFLTFAKVNPRERHYGYFNASARVSAALFAIRADIELSPVPYRQIATAINDLANCQIYTVFVDMKVA